MNKNCVILIDCRESFQLQHSTEVINYLEKYKPELIINANYPVDIWVFGDNNLIHPVEKDYEFTGTFEHLGISTIKNNKAIQDYLDSNNIKYFDIIDPNELINLNEFKEIESITIMGSAWHKCLHVRSMSFNFLPKIINSNIEILTYSLGCARSAEETIDVDDQIKIDKDWIPMPYPNMYKFIGTR